MITLLNLNSISNCYGQEASDSVEHSIGDLLIANIHYGTYFYKQDFNGQLNNFDHSKIFNPIQTIGISLSGIYSNGDKHTYGIHFSYAQVIPQKVNVNDTTGGIINGFNFGCSFYGLNLTPKSKFSSTIVGIGFNTGRLRIKSESYKSQKNPFFAPVISLSPKFYLGKITIGLRTEYQLDVSKKGWRSVNFTNKKNSISVLKLNQSALITYFSLGWKF
ncbi:hypothetical protein [Brumimicrobium sp.]|uniref:hypothetical protein n=1 Tax=Brumimicrobium sp. TaxID=2029867 RepID=UPI003A8DCC45